MRDFATTYYLYVGTVVLSTLFAWLAAACPIRVRERERLNPFFWFLSLAILWFVMGFRLEMGFDYRSYEDIFYDTGKLGILGYYESGKFLEPGYLLLINLLHLVCDDFACVFACTSLIGLLFLYSAFAYESRRINPAWCVFVFASTQYFYFWGIDRLFLSVSIVSYGLRFIAQRRTSRYCVMVLVAAMIHASALFMLCVPFLDIPEIAESSRGPAGEQKAAPKMRIGWYLFLLCLTPVLFYGLIAIMPYLPERYAAYGGGDDMSSDEEGLLGTSYSLAVKAPVALLIAMNFRRSATASPASALYSVMYVASLFVQLFASFVGVGRVAWYFWIPLCMAIPFTIKGCSRDVLARVAVVVFTMVYCAGYMTHAYLRYDTSRGEVMFPYRNIFFEL